MAVSLLAAALLTAFIYGQAVFLVFSGGWFSANGILHLLRIQREPGLVWILALLCSATAGIALHLGSFLLWPSRPPSPGSGRSLSYRQKLPTEDRLTTVRDLTNLGCFAGLNVLLVYRILTFVYFFDLRLLPLPPVFRGFARSADLSSWSARPALWLLLAGAMALAIATMQAGHLLPRLGGRRAGPFLALVLSLAIGLAASLLTPLDGGFGKAPSVSQDAQLRKILDPLPPPNQKATKQLDLYQGTGLGTRFHHLPAASSRYFMARDTVASRAASPNETPCGLPVLDVFVWRGLTIDLDPSGPSSPAPAAMVELPRGKGFARLYRASDLRWTETRPLERIGRWEPGGDWVILKADPNVAAKTVYRLLASLREAGVHRLTLSAIPGRLPLELFESRSPEPPVMVLGEGDPALSSFVDLLAGAEFAGECQKLLCTGYPDMQPFCVTEDYLNLHVDTGLPYGLRFPPLIRLDHRPLDPGDVIFYQQFVSMIEVATLHGGRKLYLAPPF